jgi:5'-3' exonuclease
VRESTEVVLNINTVYLVDGLQRYYAVQQLNKTEFTNWPARRLIDENETVEGIQKICYQLMALQDNTTPLTFVDRCNLIVKYSANPKYVIMPNRINSLTLK